MKGIFLIIVSFCLHYVLVQFGSLFTIPSGFASVIWPVTGVMLGLYLVYGRAVLVGVFLSALLVLQQEQLTASLSLFQYLVLSCVGILQLVISKWLLERCCDLPLKTYIPMEIIKSLVLIGPVAVLISFVFAIPALGYAFVNNIEMLSYMWAVKWLGESLSIVFITPIFLFVTDNIYIKKARTSLSAIVTSLISLVLISLIYLFLDQQSYQAQERKFVKATQPFIQQFNVFQSQIKTQLKSLNGLFQASDHVSRDEFKIFTDTINTSNFNVRALAWVPLITAEKRAEFEQSISAELSTDIKIKSLTEQGFVTTSEQAQYAPITYIEPLAVNKSALGLDLFTHPVVKYTIEKAITHKDFVISPLLTLAQQRNKFTGAIVYYPVYKNIENSDQQTLLGLVEVVIEVDVLFAGLYQQVSTKEFSYRVNYGDNNVYQHADFHPDSVFNYSVEVDVFDKKGKLSFTSTAAFELGLINYLNLIIVVISCMIGVICVMFIFFILRFNSSLSKKVNESTQLLTQKNEALVLANQAKSLFLANISHEYRTPLNAIIGFTEIAQREIADPQAVSYFKQIQHSSNILLAIVNDVLDTSKIQAGELTLDCQPFQPTEITSIVLDILSEKISEKGLTVKKNFTPAFQRWVNGDDTRFQQIMINLLNNAVKFTEQGSISIFGDCHDVDDNKRKLIVEITDTGIGIEESAQQRLFEPFAQAENSTSRTYGGTGLGLSIVKQLCLLMDGNISLTSELGKGSTFTVVLHLAKANKPLMNNDIIMASDAEVANFNNAEILVVEDNKINQVVVNKQLSSFGVICHFADDGQQALTYLENNQPDLILMDLQMPVMDGFSASEQIKHNDKTQAIPIVILSASVVKEDRERAASLGIEDFINKPFKQADLLRILHKYLSINT